METWILEALEKFPTATHVAMNKSGAIFAYWGEPIQRDEYWGGVEFEIVGHSNLPYLENWRNSLRALR